MAKENMPKQIGKIEIAPVRQAFGHEALDFTMWLEKNIDTLSDRLGIELTVVEREKTVGSFKVDLLCEDGNSNTVIVENQLERTDHDHLGKLLTYLINLDAKTAIWVTPEPRPEHEKVIETLNEWTGSNIAFYLVQVEAVRIGDSPFAPLFTILAAPDEQTKETGEAKKEWADRHYKRLEFWTSLQARSKGKTQLFSNLTPGKDSWFSTSIGKAGLSLVYRILLDRAVVEIYIDTGLHNLNKAIFDALKADSKAIEADLDKTLLWLRLDEKRASRIVLSIEGHGGLNEPETWSHLQDLMIETMIRFDQVMRPRIRHLRTQ